MYHSLYNRKYEVSLSAGVYNFSNDYFTLKDVKIVRGQVQRSIPRVIQPRGNSKYSVSSFYVNIVYDSSEVEEYGLYPLIGSISYGNDKDMLFLKWEAGINIKFWSNMKNNYYMTRVQDGSTSSHYTSESESRGYFANASIIPPEKKWYEYLDPRNW